MRADKSEREKEDSRGVRNSATLAYESDGHEIATMCLRADGSLASLATQSRSQNHSEAEPDTIRQALSRQWPPLCKAAREEEGAIEKKQ